MKYYKNPTTGEVFAFEGDGSQDEYIFPELVQMTQAEIDAHLTPRILPPSKAEQLATITVTTQSGKIFDGNETARTDILSALTTGELIGATSTNWKLADNTVAIVTRDELLEALALAIQEKGRIVGAI
jgi:hypothetical protein